MNNPSLASWTPPTSPYPPYLNASLDGEHVVVTLREAPFHGVCGDTISLRIPSDDFLAFMLTAAAEFRAINERDSEGAA